MCASVTLSCFYNSDRVKSYAALLRVIMCTNQECVKDNWRARRGGFHWGGGAGDGGGLRAVAGARAYAWRQSGPRRRVAADANGSEMLSALIIYYDQCRYGPAGVAYHGGKLLHR